MTTYHIDYDEVVHYLGTDIRANSKEEAKDIFVEMLNNGEIEIVDSDGNLDNITEVKE